MVDFNGVANCMRTLTILIVQIIGTSYICVSPITLHNGWSDSRRKVDAGERLQYVESWCMCSKKLNTAFHGIRVTINSSNSSRLLFHTSDSKS